jgi:hypothetical protein
MQNFERIYFIREYIIGYYSIVALFLSNYDKKRFVIVNKSDIKAGDLIGVTIFSMNSMETLRKVRKDFPKNEIICGGIGVFTSYNRILKFADYVYFGEGYEFDTASILSKKFEKASVKINRQIDYKKLPLVKIGQKNYYNQIEVGCPYRCGYCLVSWVNKFSKITDQDFTNRIRSIDSKLKNCHIVFIGNEGIVKEKNKQIFDIYKNNKYDNQSIILKNYLQNFNLYKDQNIVRFGVELPTEDLRKIHLPPKKHILDSELMEVITEKYIRTTQFFYIWNYIDTKESDYLKIFDIVKHKKDFLLRLNFTTLEIQPYVKINPKLETHINQLLTTKDFQKSEVIDKLRNVSKVKIFAGKKNNEVLKQYLFTYTNLDLNTQITDSVIKTITGNANKMKIENDEISIIKF